jgi:hypothetical protein
MPSLYIYLAPTAGKHPSSSVAKGAVPSKQQKISESASTKSKDEEEEDENEEEEESDEEESDDESEEESSEVGVIEYLRPFVQS